MLHVSLPRADTALHVAADCSWKRIYPIQEVVDNFDELGVVP